MGQFVDVLLPVCCLSLLSYVSGEGTVNNETEVVQFLAGYNEVASVVKNRLMQTKWDYETNMTENNEEQFIKQEMITAKFLNDMRALALMFNSSAMTPDIQRQLIKVKNIGVAVLPIDTTFQEVLKVESDIERIYWEAKVCLAPTECLTLEPDITSVMAKSRDYNKLLAVWVAWQNETGSKMRENYFKFIKLINQGARLLGFRDGGHQWQANYETETLENDARALLDQIHPLYVQLHAFVRRRLKRVYGESRFPSTGQIPAHILGNLWAQHWDKIFDLLIPFENKPTLDITSGMIKQNYTVQKMFRTAEDFFLSLGFEELSPTFWNRSRFEKNKNVQQEMCHNFSWDFFDKKDYRIRMCATVTQDDLIAVYHEMGRMQYKTQYKDQPLVYRESASEAFEEAVGELASLSVQTPQHLRRLDLINESSTDNDMDINWLMKVALQKVAFLPFSYVLDTSRWHAFSEVDQVDFVDHGHNYPNIGWWRSRCELQGISPPVPRSEENFDPGTEYDVAVNVPYIRYFFGFIIQFQFLEAFCKTSNYSGPLHRCDIYNNKDAGAKLRNMMELGSSKPWTHSMKELTGQDKMDARPLLEYFKPLMDFLRKENGNDYGWDPSCPSVLI